MAAIHFDVDLIESQYESPPMTKFHSPTKRDLKRSQDLLHHVLFPRLMKQERIHAASKRPQFRCAVEADLLIQDVLISTQNVKDRYAALEQEFHNLEGKVDKLELELENGQKHHMIHQLSFNPGEFSIIFKKKLLLKIVKFYIV
jgi:hypothetical protein